MKVAVPKPGARPAAPAVRRPAAAAAAPPEFELVSATREITVRDLLTHGSGLMSGGLGQQRGAAARRRPTRWPPTSRSWARVPLDFQPGTLWRYSGLAGFDVLSRIVEVASGQPFDQFLQAAAVRSARHEGHRLLRAARRRGAPGDAVSAHARRARSSAQPNQNGLSSATYFSGAGGLLSTAEDYLQFAQMLLNGGELNGRRYLSPRTVRADDVEPHRRHGERPVRPPGRAAWASASACRWWRIRWPPTCAQSKGSVGLGRRLRHQRQHRPDREDGDDHHDADVHRRAAARLRERRLAGDRRVGRGFSPPRASARSHDERPHPNEPRGAD